MPSTCCSVPECNERGGHVFPKDSDLRRKWIIAIKRLDERSLKPWAPTSSSVVCKRHFTPNDYVKETKFGRSPTSLRLLPTAIPSIFPWSKDASESATGRTARASEREVRKRKWDESCKQNLESSFCLDMKEEIVEESIPEASTAFEDTFPTISFDKANQTVHAPMFSIDNCRHDNEFVHFYTGLESYSKFAHILYTLGPAAYCLKYLYFQVVGVSVENQFLMTLMKLRRYTTNFELSRFFSISEPTVKNIVYTWIIFMSRQWREVNIWPSQRLVQYFSPSDFKRKFPSTRIIVDGTECPIKKPKAPRAQQATFSTYKNRNTVKVLIGATPGGLTTFISTAYAGSTSDRQIVERCNLVKMCDPLDSVMADKGFNVQDLFANRNITVNVPTFFRKKNRMSGKIVMNDRKISSKRVHIERIIGLGKTFKILKNPLNSTETKMASDIIFVCFMLCNFRKCIVSKDA